MNQRLFFLLKHGLSSVLCCTRDFLSLKPSGDVKAVACVILPTCESNCYCRQLLTGFQRFQKYFLEVE